MLLFLLIMFKGPHVFMVTNTVNILNKKMPPLKRLPYVGNIEKHDPAPAKMAYQFITLILDYSKIFLALFILYYDKVIFIWYVPFADNLKNIYL